MLHVAAAATISATAAVTQGFSDSFTDGPARRRVHHHGIRQTGSNAEKMESMHGLLRCPRAVRSRHAQAS